MSLDSCLHINSLSSLGFLMLGLSRHPPNWTHSLDPDRLVMIRLVSTAVGGWWQFVCFQQVFHPDMVEILRPPPLLSPSPPAPYYTIVARSTTTIVFSLLRLNTPKWLSCHFCLVDSRFCPPPPDLLRSSDGLSPNSTQLDQWTPLLGLMNVCYCLIFYA